MACAEEEERDKAEAALKAEKAKKEKQKNKKAKQKVRCSYHMGFVKYFSASPSYLQATVVHSPSHSSAFLKPFECNSQATLVPLTSHLDALLKPL